MTKAENVEKTKRLLGGGRFVCSYSGGKDSTLALARAVQCGGKPQQLIMTYNIDAGRTWFHGIPEPVVKRAEASLGIPVKMMRTPGEEYGIRMEAELRAQKEAGADVCVFGDIDLEEHLIWCTERCENAGITGLFPLWQEARESLVYEFIDSGFEAYITVLDTKKMSERFLGERLTREVADAIRAEGADICGENGEYHTFVANGPIYKTPVAHTLGKPFRQDGYAIVPVMAL